MAPVHVRWESSSGPEVSKVKVSSVVGGSWDSGVLPQLDRWLKRPFTGKGRGLSTDKQERLEGESTCPEDYVQTEKMKLGREGRGI